MIIWISEYIKDIKNLGKYYNKPGGFLCKLLFWLNLFEEFEETSVATTAYI